MKERIIDLHVHSCRSDGTMTPEELVRHAAQAGLDTFALTDHDTTEGIAQAMLAADSCGIELIPGIEFSTEYLRTDVHVVGLEINHKDPALEKELQYYRDRRLERNRKMIRKMADDGIDITYEEMCEKFGKNNVWTRAHFGRHLLDKGYVSSMQEAFERYIGDTCKYFVPREKVSPIEVTRLIRRYGGIPILAHPYQYHFSEDVLRTLLEQMKAAGLIGMEVYYSTYSAEQMDTLLALAQSMDLLPSGGSDFHGSNKPHISIGTGIDQNLHIPYSILDALRSRK